MRTMIVVPSASSASLRLQPAPGHRMAADEVPVAEVEVRVRRIPA
jgi:hypothetical protein